MRDEQHEQTAVGCHQLAAEQHGERAGQGATNHTGRDDAHRILGGKRDGPLGDKAQSQYEGGFTRFLLRLDELGAGQEGRDPHPQRRHHTGGHHRSHRGIGFGGQQADTEGVGRLVDRAAHVKAHHGTDDDTQQHGVGRAHVVEELGHGIHDAGHRATHHIDHHQTGKEAGKERNDQDRLERFQGHRQAHLVAQVLGAVTGQKTGHDTAKETGAQRACQHAADHAGSETRTVSDGVGNVAGQHRDHQGEGGATTDLHQSRGQRAFHLERLDTEHERERDNKTARHHHGQHKGDAGQQVLVGAGFFLFLGLAGTAVAIECRLVPRLVEFGAGFLQCRARAGTIDRLTVKARHVHFDIGGEEYQIGRCNLLGSQGVLGTDRALGLDADLITQLFGHGLQRFCRHKGVGNASRARCHCHDALASGGGFGGSIGNGGVGLMTIDAGTAGCCLQQGCGILQGKIHAALIDSLAIIGGEIHRGTGDNQHQISGGNLLF